MKQNASKRILSLLLAMVMVIGLVPVAAMPVFAQNVTGVMYASGIRGGEALVLWGDTTLNMDTDLTVPSIEGDYNLTVQGSGKLTVNGSGNGIDVKSLKCYSDVFIQTGWHAIEVTETVYIDNADSFIVGGIYAAGHIDIRCNNATIAGNSNAISSTLGSITLSGTFDIGANDRPLNADAGNIYMEGDFRVVTDKGWAMEVDNGGISVDGSLEVSSGSGSGIYAAKGFSFYGTTLNVESVVSGINSGGDISITATSTTIIAKKDSPISGKYVYIDSDYLYLQNRMEEENHPLANWAGIRASGDVSVTSNDATIIGKYGISTNSWGVDSDGNLSLTGVGNVYLTGNFYVVGAIENAILCSKDLTVEGSLTAQGSVIEQSSDNPFYYGVCFAISADNFTFNGSALDVKGYAGIEAENCVEIRADSVSVSTDVADAIFGKEVYVATESLWAENKATKTNETYNYGQYGIHAQEELILDANGTVLGYDDALHSDDHYVYVNGSVTAVSKAGAGMAAPNGNVNLYGGPMVAVGDTHGISAKNVTFEGGSLTVTGPGGISADETVDLQGSDVRITADEERNSGILCKNGYVYLDGNVIINTEGWYGIYTATDLTFKGGYYKITGPKGNAQAVKLGGKLYMDEELQIVEPKYGHVNGNDIYGAGDSPAMDVTIFSALDEVSLYITAPSEGNRPTWDASGIYYLDPRCTVEKIVWYENGVEMSGDAVFKAGKSYSVQLILSADGDYHFVDNMVGKVNGDPVFTGISANKLMLLEANLGTCASTIGLVGLTIDAPEQYSYPDQSVVCANSAYKQALAGENMFDAPVQWQKSTDGKNWSIMNLNETFTVGNYYRVFVDIMPAAGYEFDLDPQLDPDVFATVNNYPAVVSRYPEADPAQLISVCYDFGQLNDTVIEQIDIDGVVEPVVGENPSYTCAISGSGYGINTAYDNGTYAINGMCWYDVTDDMWVRPNHTFQIGHQYKVFVDVQTYGDYEFYTTSVGSSDKPAGWGYINGNYATFGIQSDARFEQSLSWTFTCQPKTVKSVAVMDLEVPADGFTPDFDAVTDSDYYTVESIVWTDYTTGIDMTEDDTFVAGNEYWVMITVVPKEEEGNKLCKFLSSNKTAATLNGIEVKDLPDDSWQEVTSSAKRVVIFYTFKKASSAKDNNFLTGTVTSFNDAAGEITLQLIPQGLPEVAYETVVRGNTVDYYFAGVAAGTYTLRVSKKNHVTREYTVTVANGSVVQDVKICLLGDVTGDGRVNVGDTAKLYSHIRKTAILTDAYQLLCGNVNGGSLNVGDVAGIYSHVRGTKKLY